VADDDDRRSSAPSSSGEPGGAPDTEKQANVIRLAIPKWLIVFNFGGTMLAVRLMMTTSYVQAWRLEKYAVALALVFGFAIAARVVFSKKHAEAPAEGEAPAPLRRKLRQLVIIAGLVAFPVVLPMEGCLALANRVGMLDDVKTLQCKAERVESRAKLQGRRNVVFFACTAPDGATLRGRADEVFSIEPGNPLTMQAARGRLGVWIRLGPPEPVRRD